MLTAASNSNFYCIIFQSEFQGETLRLGRGKFQMKKQKMNVFSFQSGLPHSCEFCFDEKPRRGQIRLRVRKDDEEEATVTATVYLKQRLSKITD